MLISSHCIEKSKIKEVNMAVKKITRKEVEQFLKKREKRYENCLALIKNEFKVFKNSRESEGKIYTVYSRGEKQNNKEFKDIEKIVEKINKYRRDGVDVCTEDDNGNITKEKIMTPKFPLRDLGDIVGITVVCVYPGDKKIVGEMIERKVREKSWKVFEKEPKYDDGYYAIHYVLGIHNHRGIRVEVQVKTLLHDAWGAMTHDLTYKPQIRLIDMRYKNQIDALGDSIQLINKQSEIVGEFIREQWNLDKKREEAAV